MRELKRGATEKYGIDPPANTTQQRNDLRAIADQCGVEITFSPDGSKVYIEKD